MIVEEYVPKEPQPNRDIAVNDRQIVVFSAANRDRLRAVVMGMFDYIKSHPDFPMLDFAHTLRTGREAMDARIAMVVSTREELISILIAFLASENSDEIRVSSVPFYSADLGKNGPELRSLLTGRTGEAMLQTLLKERDLEKLARCWIQGGNVPWEKVYPDINLRFLLLPTYPFNRSRYWLSNPGKTVLSTPAPEQLNGIAPSLEAVGHDSVREFIESFLLKELRIAADLLNPDRNMLEFGMNSILAMKLMRSLNKRFDLKVTGREMLENPSVNALVDHIAEKLNVQVQRNKGNVVSETKLERETTVTMGRDMSTPPLAPDMTMMQALEKFQAGLLDLEEMEAYVPQENCNDR